MIHHPLTGWLCLTAAILPLSAASARPAPQQSTPRALVERFEAARRDFDPATLATTLAPDFVEISPRGEVDPRDKVLGFYDPRLKHPAPPIESDEVTIRSVGDTALVTQRLSFTLPGATSRRSVRVLYVARRVGGGWQLLSAQYTPIPPELAK
ncbi:nuclear transport factor 2 family protein [Sphingomonas sanguinis]|uniref:Nuclear transport factor 2 family protein n=1 Tax=Sphingomonas sanguinis TaxID=33051 RepID=A0ABU5LR54_9SPHN|nr:nuclear transport factor 2 family protein [Sphingomonas sanguinis]MDZ7282382.1 nuclear transport factor 2 family protein [Sphingomonas sanguinis]QXT34693.1 nuclear transport factor 2 family protein [Sphingomonas sanguinis]